MRVTLLFLAVLSTTTAFSKDLSIKGNDPIVQNKKIAIYPNPAPAGGRFFIKINPKSVCEHIHQVYSSKDAMFESLHSLNENNIGQNSGFLHSKSWPESDYALSEAEMETSLEANIAIFNLLGAPVNEFPIDAIPCKKESFAIEVDTPDLAGVYLLRFEFLNDLLRFEYTTRLVAKEQE